MSQLTELESALRQVMVGQGQADVEVVDLDLREIEDLDDHTAWRVVLYLTAPKSDSWDVGITRELKTRSRRELDRLALELGIQADGVTSVAVTTKDAPEEQIAEDDQPVTDEATSSSEVHES